MIFLNQKIFLTKQHIVMAVVKYCADHNDDMPGLAKMIDNGAISIVEFSDEIVMELIRYAYDLNMNEYLGRDKREKKESVIGAIEKHKVEDREKLKEKKEIIKEFER